MAGIEINKAAFENCVRKCDLYSRYTDTIRQFLVHEPDKSYQLKLTVTNTLT